MTDRSPVAVLGQHADRVRTGAVEVVRQRHARAAESSEVAESAFRLGFGTQWRDLLAESCTEFGDFPQEQLLPAGYRVPVVNGCIIYIWRRPVGRSKSKAFGRGHTRIGALNLRSSGQLVMEFDGNLPESGTAGDQELNEIVRAAPASMPFVAIVVESTADGLMEISWAVVGVDGAGVVRFDGEETIWQVEPTVSAAAVSVAPFDSGDPIPPVVEPRPAEARPGDDDA